MQMKEFCEMFEVDEQNIELPHTDVVYVVWKWRCEESNGHTEKDVNAKDGGRSASPDAMFK